MDSFMEGYKRAPQTTSALVGAITHALYAAPTMRLGQLLINAMGEDDLFSIYDEELVDRLHDFIRINRVG